MFIINWDRVKENQIEFLIERKLPIQNPIRIFKEFQLEVDINIHLERRKIIRIKVVQIIFLSKKSNEVLMYLFRIWKN